MAFSSFASSGNTVGSGGAGVQTGPELEDIRTDVRRIPRMRGAGLQSILTAATGFWILSSCRRCEGPITVFAMALRQSSPPNFLSHERGFT